MSTRLDIVPLTEDIARAIAARMRPGDAAEVLAADGHTPEQACLNALRSEVARAALFDGVPAAMWGTHVFRRSVMGDVGSIWLLTTDLIERHPVLFMRGCRAELRRIFEEQPRVRFMNAIDVRYAQAIRWASRLGFRLLPPAPYGVAGLPVRWFTVGKEDV